MNKKIVAGFALALFAVAGVASAATVDNNFSYDGTTQVYGTPGADKEVTVRVNIDSGDALRAFRVDFVSDGINDVCVDVSDIKGSVEKDVDIDIELPLETGNYELRVAPMYTNHQNNGFPSGCGADGLVQGPWVDAGIGDDVHVVPNGNSNDDNNTGGTNWFENMTFDQFLKMIKDALGAQAPAPVVKPAYCAGLAAASANTYSLQSYLVINGFMTQEQVNTGPGIYGPRTTAAHLAIQKACI